MAWALYLSLTVLLISYGAADADEARIVTNLRGACG
jgi:hypothetical protein